MNIWFYLVTNEVRIKLTSAPLVEVGKGIKYGKRVQANGYI